MKMKPAMMTGVLACTMVVSSGVSSAMARPRPKDGPGPSPSVPTARPAEALEDLGDYLLAPGDTLRIQVWKEPELRADVFVRLDGRITVPLAGDVRAAGRTTEELAEEVRQKLGAFLEAPTVTITLAQAVSARFFMIGEVTRPGVYPLTGRTTVLQALSPAGGFREFAKRDRIIVIRQKRGERKAIPFNFHDLGQGEHLDQDVTLESGDTVIVP